MPDCKERGNIPPAVPGAPVSDSWAKQHPATYTLTWCVAILAVFVPLTTWRLRRSLSR